MDNRRKQIVVNRKFQHQYALGLVALIIILGNLLIICSLLFLRTDTLELQGLNFVLLAAVELVLMGAVWYAGIRASHRIAGPMYVITRELDAVGKGELFARVYLRDKDMFRDESLQINSSLDALCERVRAVQLAAGELQAARAAGVDTEARFEELLEKLGELRTQGEG